MLNICMNILVQNVVSGIFGTLSGWGLNVGLPLALTLIFGEVIPKSIAIANNEKLVLFAARFLSVVEKIVAPFRVVIIPVTNFISRSCFFFLKYTSKASPQELKHALQTSRDFGFLNPEEAKLLRGFLNMEEDTLREIMCPRGEILAYDVVQPLDRLKDIFCDKECSRVPVFENDLEYILGVMTAIEFFKHQNQFTKGKDLERYLEKPTYMPEATVAKRALADLAHSEAEMAMVVDEYGSISGLITEEDLIEVVVGQIIDKRDVEQHFTKAGDDVIIASGKMELSEFEELFEIHLESPNNMATIGGWLTEKLGDIPKEGEKVVTDRFLFHILASDATKVEKVYIRRLKK